MFIIQEPNHLASHEGELAEHNSRSLKHPLGEKKSEVNSNEKLPTYAKRFAHHCCSKSRIQTPVSSSPVISEEIIIICSIYVNPEQNVLVNSRVGLQSGKREVAGNGKLSGCHIGLQ